MLNVTVCTVFFFIVDNASTKGTINFFNQRPKDAGSIGITVEWVGNWALGDPKTRKIKGLGARKKH